MAAVGHRAENALILSLVAPGCCEQARLGAGTRQVRTPGYGNQQEPAGSRNQALIKKASSWALVWQWLGEGRGDVNQLCCGVARALQRGGILWAGLVREGFLEEA